MRKLEPEIFMDVTEVIDGKTSAKDMLNAMEISAELIDSGKYDKDEKLTLMLVARVIISFLHDSVKRDAYYKIAYAPAMLEDLDFKLVKTA